MHMNHKLNCLVAQIKETEALILSYFDILPMIPSSLSLMNIQFLFSNFNNMS